MQYKFPGGVTQFLLEVGQKQVDVNLLSQKNGNRCSELD